MASEGKSGRDESKSGGGAGSGGGKAEETVHGEGWEDIDVSELDIGKRIGGGGFAIVYEATWRGKSVAVKTLFDPKVDDALKREFMDELHSMRMLDHPNVVKFIGACCKPPKLCFVMELLDTSLYELLHKSNTYYDYVALAAMATDAAAGMAYLHGLSPPIIHRDLKSHNLLVNARKGVVKLCDFGLVHTKHTTAGTPAYMAPELLNDKPFSRKCDVYAFGVLLWEIFNRSIPFHGWRVTDIVDEVSAGRRPKWPRGHTCPKDLVAIVEDCWAQDPNDRPTFSDVEKRLRQWKPAVVHSQHISGGDSLDALM